MRLTVQRTMALITWVAVGLAAIRHVITSWGPRVHDLRPDHHRGIERPGVVPEAAPASADRFGLAGWAYLALAIESPLAETLPTSRLLEASRPPLWGPFLSRLSGRLL